VDFYGAELWLAVEVDGEVHDGRRAEDQERDEELASMGVSVVRVRNADVFDRLDAVIAQLTSDCERRAREREERKVRLRALTLPRPAGEGS
jgi:very-short-patch-repair endonuclease